MSVVKVDKIGRINQSSRFASVSNNSFDENQNKIEMDSV